MAFGSCFEIFGALIVGFMVRFYVGLRVFNDFELDVRMSDVDV